MPVTNCAMFGYIELPQRRLPPPWTIEEQEAVDHA
jgi:hypothetical protein